MFTRSKYKFLNVSSDQRKLFDTTPLHPGKILAEMLKDRGWTQDELATISGYSRQTINELISGKSGITKPELAIALGAAFGNSPLEWMHWDSAFKLSQVVHDAMPGQTAARLYEIAPIRDMQKRGWIIETKDRTKLEQELKAFFGVKSLDPPPAFPVAFRRSNGVDFFDLAPAERAWIFRARQLASALVLPLTNKFNPTQMDRCAKDLRELAAYPKEARHVANGFSLSRYGIRFVIVEQLDREQEWTALPFG